LVLSLITHPGEKDDPLAQRGRVLPQQRLERAPIELGHPQVRQDYVIALSLEPGEGVTPMARRRHPVAVVVQEPGQPADNARFIVNHSNAPRGGRGHHPP
jgi:hypothetical protein